MIVLIHLVLAIVGSMLKSKARLEAENAALRDSPCRHGCGGPVAEPFCLGDGPSVWPSLG